MKTIILEGASASGKTTIKEKLSQILRREGVGFQVINEDKTLLPYLDHPELQKSLQAIRDVLKELEQLETEVAIIDRFYFTHVLINNVSLQEFDETEKKMLPFDPLIVFLKMDEKVIKERVFEAMEHRPKSWREHVESKGSEAEIEEWYIRTQQKLLKLLDQTKLPFITFDTTEKQFDQIAETVYKDFIQYHI